MQRFIAGMVMPLAAGFMMLAAPAESQGKGQGSDKGRAADARGSDSRGRGQGQGRAKAADRDDRPSAQRGNQGRGNSDRAQAQRGNRGAASEFGRDRAAEVRESGGDVAGRARPGRGNSPFSRRFDVDNVRPIVRGFAVSNKVSERLAGRAVALAFDRGLDDARLIVRPVDDRVRVLNGAGLVLLEIDDARARNLGAWEVRPLGLRGDDLDDDREGSPAFCRSGAGHPVWGRQWCVDKGFSLGVQNDIRWGRAIDLENVVIRRRVEDRSDLTRDVLLSVLGDVVFNRLAAHALTLGFVEPLGGRWLVEPTGRRVLLVNSGTAPVAEIVDVDSDDRADVLLVALKPW